jgi:hypothetical protein
VTISKFVPNRNQTLIVGCATATPTTSRSLDSGSVVNWWYVQERKDRACRPCISAGDLLRDRLLAKWKQRRGHTAATPGRIRIACRATRATAGSFCFHLRRGCLFPCWSPTASRAAAPIDRGSDHPGLATSLKPADRKK